MRPWQRGGSEEAGEEGGDQDPTKPSADCGLGRKHQRCALKFCAMYIPQSLQGPAKLTRGGRELHFFLAHLVVKIELIAKYLP